MPPELIVAYEVLTLHVGVTEEVVLSLQVAVAVYVPVPPSFTDDGPLTDMLLSVAWDGVAEGTTHAYPGESAEISLELKTVFTVK